MDRRKQVGVERYLGAGEIFITADAGGGNSYRSQVWKQQLQRIADKLDLEIHVSHCPPGTEQVEQDRAPAALVHLYQLAWPTLRTYETVINFISNTTNHGGLVVHARLDRRNYPIGK